MILIQETSHHRYQQAIWQDYGHYIELFRLRGMDACDVLRGAELHRSVDALSRDEHWLTIPQGVGGDFAITTFPIRKGEHWAVLKGRILSYLTRMAL